MDIKLPSPKNAKCIECGIDSKGAHAIFHQGYTWYSRSSDTWMPIAGSPWWDNFIQVPLSLDCNHLCCHRCLSLLMFLLDDIDVPHACKKQCNCKKDVDVHCDCTRKK